MRRWAILGLFILAACSKGAGETPPPVEPAAANFHQNFDARGADPVWGLTIRGRQLTLSRPGQPDVVATAPGLVIQTDQASWTAAIGDGRTIKVALYASSCSSGSDEATYPFAAEVDITGETPLGGCAGKPAGRR